MTCNVLSDGLTLPLPLAACCVSYLAEAPRDQLPDETYALQARIDALAASGGGELVIGPGVHRAGALFFRPGVNLRIEKGGVLVGSDAAAAYPIRETRIEGETCDYYPALINADRCDGFRISGEGVVDGHGLPTWRAFWKAREANPRCLNKEPGLVRPRLLYVSNSSDVDVSGVTFKNSKFWTTHFYDCRNVRVRDCAIRAEILEGVKGPSTDAIDIDRCQGFVVSNVVMDVNDDAVVIKGGKGPWAKRSRAARWRVWRRSAGASRGVACGRSSPIAAGTFANTCCSTLPRRSSASMRRGWWRRFVRSC